MLRSKASFYGILAVAEVARHQKAKGGGLQAAEIALRLHLPAAYAAKVLTQLARANVLRSDRGPHGGFHLANAAEGVKLVEIIEAVDGPMSVDIDVPAPAHDPTLWRVVQEVFGDVVCETRESLRRRTVADLLDACGGTPAIT